jgi:hypothetical protein
MSALLEELRADRAEARVKELEEEVFVLREALRDILLLEQMAADSVSGGWKHYAAASREAWQRARDLMGEEG